MEIAGGGGLKRPRPSLGCSIVGAAAEEELQSKTRSLSDEYQNWFQRRSIREIKPVTRDNIIIIIT